MNIPEATKFVTLTDLSDYNEKYVMIFQNNTTSGKQIWGIATSGTINASGHATPAVKITSGTASLVD
jgi:hypothetical protein